MSRFLLLMGLFFVAPFISAQDLTPYLCDVNLSVQAPAGVPVEFPWALFTGTAGDSIGKLQVLNKSDKSVQYFLIIIELRDAKGGYIFSVPVFNADKNQNVPFDVSFKPWLFANWAGGYAHLISPASTYGATFSSPLVALSCPTSVTVSMIQLRYADGTEFQYASSTMKISTAPTGPIELANKKAAKRWAPLTTSGTIQVDSLGHVDLLDSDYSAEGFKAWFEGELNGWKFAIPWSASKPTSTKMPFVLILGDTTDPRVQVETMKKRGLDGAMLLIHFAGN